VDFIYILLEGKGERVMNINIRKMKNEMDEK